MRVQEGDYARVGGIVLGGIAGSILLAMSDHPALQQLTSAAVETIEKRNFSKDASHLVVISLLTLWLLTFVTGEVTKNYSQVDKLWSLIPPFFAWIYALDAPGNPRLLLMAFIISIWGIRLTLNFYRRGGYTWPPWLGEEDYRWKHVQAFLNAEENPTLWKAFHLGFICVYQILLLYFICLPCHFVWYADKYEGHKPVLSEMDVFAALAILACIAGEAITDEEQFEFQEGKYELLNQGIKRESLPMPYRQGFLSKGMFAYSRHMNYFCEQSIWFLLNLYVYVVNARKEFFTPALGGFVLLAVLFQGSIWLQEQTTVDRWPLYAKYIEQVPQLFPYGSGFTNPSEED